MEKYDVFFSYSRKDYAVVSKFVDCLEKAGFRVWIDKQGIEGGDQFPRVIVDAIDNSSLFVFFSSKSSNDSIWTEKEINYAHKKGKVIIPVKLDNSPYIRSRLILTDIDYINERNNNDAMNKLLNLVKVKIKPHNNDKKDDEDKGDKGGRYKYKYGIVAISLVAFSFFIVLGVFFVFNNSGEVVNEDQKKGTESFVDNHTDTATNTLMRNENNSFKDSASKVDFGQTDVSPHEEKNTLLESNDNIVIEKFNDFFSGNDEITNNNKSTGNTPHGFSCDYSSDLNSIVFTSNSNDIQFVMKLVEGGTFLMGGQFEDYSKPNFFYCDIFSYDKRMKERFCNEAPVHQVSLNSYYLGETEVTQELWLYVVGYEPTFGDHGWTFGRGNDYPAYYVSWEECQNFINKLNKLTGCSFRLPTEEEWEFAARGGRKGSGNIYSGGNNMDDLGWYCRNSGEVYLTGDLYKCDLIKTRRDNKNKTQPVKTKCPNELGLYDMSGNVWEMCSNKYYSYSYSYNNKQTNNTGNEYVQRGGSWGSVEDFCRVSCRDTQKEKRNATGFRLALSK